MRNSYYAVCIAAFVSATLASCKKEDSRDAVKNIPQCPSQFIIVIDRTTKLDSTSRKLLLSGVNSILDDIVLRGEFSAYEVSATALGYRTIIAPLTIGSPIPSVVPKKCPIDVYGDNYSKCFSENKKSEDKSAQERENRAKNIANIKKALNTLASDDAVDERDTNISDALEHIMETRCDGQYCVVYIFSDLIENASRVLSHSKAAVNSVELDKVVATKVALSFIDPLRMKGRRVEVLAWGVGRDEIYGRELPPYGRVALVGYWQRIFGKLGVDSSLRFEYEFPLLERSTFPGARSVANCAPKT